MYNIDDVGGLYESLPPNLQSVENDCLGYAVDRQISKLYRIALSLTVWSDLDGVDPRYYDQMAMTIKAPYYKSEYSDSVKLELIRSALMTRKYAGSGKAIDELVGNAFTYAVFAPWYEYGGEPYHFKVIIKDEPDEDSKALFEDMVRKVKAARSVIDGVELDADALGMGLYYGVAAVPVRVVYVENMENVCERLHGGYYVRPVVVTVKDLKIGGND